MKRWVGLEPVEKFVLAAAALAFAVFLADAAVVVYFCLRDLNGCCR